MRMACPKRPVNIVVRLALSLSIGAAGLASMMSSGQTEEYPSRLIRAIVPSGAGTNLDAVGRIITNELQRIIGETVVVENRVGGDLVVGARSVVNAPADGYTMLIQSTSLFYAWSAMKDPGFTLASFQVIGGIAYAPFLLMINTKSSGAKDLKEFVAVGKAQPKKIKIAAGSSQQSVLLGQFKEYVGGPGFDWVEVPFKGNTDQITATLGGHVDGFFQAPSIFLAIQNAPDTLIVGVADKVRNKMLPDIPTFAELGYPGVLSLTTVGIAVRAETPEPIVTKLRQALAEAMKSADVRKRIEQTGYAIFEGSVADYDASVVHDKELFEADAKKRGIVPQ